MSLLSQALSAQGGGGGGGGGDGSLAAGLIGAGAGGFSLRPGSSLGKKKTEEEIAAARAASNAAASQRRAEEQSERPRQQRTRGGAAARQRQTSTREDAAAFEGLQKSENAYKPAATAVTVSASEDLKRQVQNVLNKMTRDKYRVLMDEHVSNQVLPSVGSAKNLRLMTRVIFDKAVQEARHGFADLYANMCVELAEKAPKYGEVTFARALVACCQEEFLSLPPSLEPSEEERKSMDPDDLEIKYTKEKNRVLGNMQFIGELFKRQLIASPVIRGVLEQLILSPEKPEALYVECVCKLLATVGAKLETQQQGADMIKETTTKLTKLATAGAYPMRLKFAIMDMGDLQRNGWVPRQPATTTPA